MLRAPISEYIYPILYQVQLGILALKDWVWAFYGSIFTSQGSLAPLRPLFVIGIAVSVIFVSILLIKKVVWGK